MKAFGSTEGLSLDSIAGASLMTLGAGAASIAGSAVITGEESVVVPSL